MANFELVEKLRERANVTYDEAKAALEACGDDLLEAMILLEKQGKVRTPKNGGFYSTKSNKKKSSNYDYCYYDYHNEKKGSVSAALSKFFGFCGKLIHMANTNIFVIKRNDIQLVALPVSVLILFIIFAAWITLPLLIIGLFLGCRYRFYGEQTEKTSINNAMNKASDVADSIKQEFSDGFSNSDFSETDIKDKE